MQDLVGLVISMLLLGDFSLVLLTLLQLYSFSLAHVLLVLFILPLGILLPFPAGINALFSQGPRRSAGLARIYALWNITSLVNVVSSWSSIIKLQNLMIQIVAYTHSVKCLLIGFYLLLLPGGCFYMWLCSLLHSA